MVGWISNLGCVLAGYPVYRLSETVPTPLLMVISVKLHCGWFVKLHAIDYSNYI